MRNLLTTEHIQSNRAIASPNPWKTVLHILNVNIFAWKAYHEALRIAAGLVSRKVLNSACSNFGSSAWELVEHSLLIVTKPRLCVWKHNSVTVNIRTFRAYDSSGHSLLYHYGRVF